MSLQSGKPTTRTTNKKNAVQPHTATGLEYPGSQSNVTTEPDWQRIESFIGYGRIDAPVVFVGMEEGLADPSALGMDLALRSQFKPVMDLEQAHRGIANGEALFSDSPRRQPTWRVMADLMLRFEGRDFADAADRANARRTYRAKNLGREDGKSLLTELLPYPNPRTRDWLYADRFETRDDYEEVILPPRVTLLQGVLTGFKRSAVVCYGKGAWDNYKSLFPNVQWEETQTACGRFACADWGGVPVTLTNHFSSKCFNTDVQLDNLATFSLRRI
jgi:hypothetical protein